MLLCFVSGRLVKNAEEALWQRKHLLRFTFRVFDDERLFQAILIDGLVLHPHPEIAQFLVEAGKGVLVSGAGTLANTEKPDGFKFPPELLFEANQFTVIPEA